MTSVRYAYALTLTGLLATVAASEVRAGPCFTTFPQQRTSGTLNAGASLVIRKWTSRCTGLFTASSGGGTPVLFVRAGDKWVEARRGAAIHMPQLGPGRYRLVVENVTTATARYDIRFRTSGG